MNKRRSNATGYERWMMKTATNGSVAFGVPLSDPTKKPGEGAAGPKDPSESGPRGKKGKKEDGLEEEGKGEEDEEEEAARRDRLSLTKKGGGGGGDDDEDDGGKGDIDLDDDDIEKGILGEIDQLISAFAGLRLGLMDYGVTVTIISSVRVINGHISSIMC
jgi:transcription initiation factor TFIIF subunit alpha